MLLPRRRRSSRPLTAAIRHPISNNRTTSTTAAFLLFLVAANSFASKGSYCGAFLPARRRLPRTLYEPHGRHDNPNFDKSPKNKYNPSIRVSNKNSKMGLFVSLFQPQQTDQKKKRKKDLSEKEARAIAWKNKVGVFEEQVLDKQLYIQHPIRANTIDAADEYEQTTSTQSAANSAQSTLLPGTHKHLGGAFDPADGCIYGVPASAKAVLVLYPKLANGGESSTDTDADAHHQQLKVDIHDPSLDTTQLTYGMTYIPLPASIASTRFKWLRGIFHNGYMYAIPAWANAILRVDVDAFWGRRSGKSNDIITLIPLPPEHPPDMRWQWHGAGINKEKTGIYCIPSNAQKVLKLDLTTHKASLLDIEYDKNKYQNFKIDLGNKWYGGILGEDNAVYGVPYRASATLRIDCNTDKVTLVGPDYGLAGYNWHGGIKVNGKIYAHPSHANYTVLVIDTNQKGQCYELPIERSPEDTCERTNYKWLGGSLGADGNIYCPACDVTAALKIDVTTDKCTTFGFAGELKNKWQGGVLANDGCVYCIPASGLHVLRMATFEGAAADTGENPLQLLGDLPKHKDKWQGGHVGVDGNLYFIPENGYRVLKVKTPQSPPKIVNGKLPEDDVTIEML